MLGIGVSRRSFRFAADALRWAVADFLLTCSVNLNQLGIINVASEGTFDGIQVDLKPSVVNCTRCASRPARSSMNIFALGHHGCRPRRKELILCPHQSQPKSKRLHIRSGLSFRRERSSLWRSRKPRFHRTESAGISNCGKCGLDNRRKPGQALPTVLRMVTFETPVMRTVELIEFPSTSAAITWLCFLRLSLFMASPHLQNDYT